MSTKGFSRSEILMQMSVFFTQVREPAGRPHVSKSVPILFSHPLYNKTSCYSLESV